MINIKTQKVPIYFTQSVISKSRILDFVIPTLSETKSGK